MAAGLQVVVLAGAGGGALGPLAGGGGDGIPHGVPVVEAPPGAAEGLAPGEGLGRWISNPITSPSTMLPPAYS